MPLLHLIGRTGHNTSFSIAFVFLGGEDVEEYLWALGEISKMFRPCQLPAVIVSDADPALPLAIEHISPNLQHLLCIWHINKNVLVQGKSISRTMIVARNS